MKTEYDSTRPTAGAMCGDHTKDGSIRRKWSAPALSGFFFASILALSTPSVDAQCKQWDVSGVWSIYQGKAWIPISLTQNGKAVTGSAQHEARLGQRDFKRLVEGAIKGTAEGDNFNVEIKWPDGLTGIYQGTIGKGGLISGTTYDKNKPSSNAQWQSSRAMKCADATAVQPTNPPPKVLKGTGRARPQTQASAPPVVTPPPAVPAPPPASSKTGPTITANPRVVIIPAGRTTGTTTLAWDAGNDHPYAEVWVKVDDGDESQIVEQGKGSRQMNVQPGRNYLYILTDSGERLSTVTVTTR